MAVDFRNYTSTPGITDDYFRVRSFLVGLRYSEFTYARWDWMTTHSYLDQKAIGRVGLWLDNGKIVGLATFDCQLGETFCLAEPGYETLRRDMLLYARDHLRRQGGHFGIVIRDTDVRFQKIAAELGFELTKDKEHDAAFHIGSNPTEYSLPEGFRITTMRETFDLYQYGQVLWKGFNHELNGEGTFTMPPDKKQAFEAEMLRPNVDLDLKIAVVAPDGNFASYCGMWYEPEAGFAVIEPVATVPDYRRLGLGRAAVLEGIRRVAGLGAQMALVGSDQQFYYSIGLRPHATSSIWRETKLPL